MSAAWLASQPPTIGEAFLRSLSDDELEWLRWRWRFWARAAQIAPHVPFTTWLLLGGRGFGKTRSAAEWIRERVEDGARRLIFAGATSADLRDIMVEGESGILAISPPWDRPDYEPSKRRLTWKNGARAVLLSADEPERFRGQQCDTYWADELAAWRFPEAAMQLALGHRLGVGYGIEPRCVISTTPRPTDEIRDLVLGKLSAHGTRIPDKSVVITGGSTYENEANLSPTFIHEVVKRYEGTRLGQQELHAKLLSDAPGALWKQDEIALYRLRCDEDGLYPLVPELRRVVVAVDPATTSGEHSNETGIVVIGIGDEDGHGYLLEDASGKYSPDEWAEKVVTLFDEWEADDVVAEANQGGDLVASNLRTERRDLPVRLVHASKGKRTRAEPVASLYQQGRVHHVGIFNQLEQQMTSWEPAVVNTPSPVKRPILSDSPDRVDALVWGVTFLMIARDPKKKRAGRRPRLNLAVPFDQRTIG